MILCGFLDSFPIGRYFNWIRPMQTAQQSPPDIFLSHTAAHLPDAALGRGVFDWWCRARLSPPLTIFYHYLFLSRGPACPCSPAAAMQACKRWLLRVARRLGEVAMSHHHPRLPGCRNQPFLASVLRRTGEEV
jgi:hypothetical protein